MIDALAFTITVGCLCAAVVVLGLVAAGRYRWRRIVPALLLVQVAVLGQAVLDVIGLLAGRRPAETVTHLAYLATSLAVLPAATAAARDDDRWSGVLTGVALVVLAVVVVRLTTTWR